MTPIASISPVTSLTAKKPNSTGSESELRSAFQESVGGLFYGQMIKAMRSGVGKPAYIHGGQAEEMFQTQMDQQVAQDLAKEHAGGFVEELFQRFLVDHPTRPAAAASQISSLDQAANSAALTESAEQARWASSAKSGAGMTTGTAVIPALNRK